MSDVEAIILAGGYSSRAGTFKSEFDIEGKPLLARSVETFLEHCDSILVVAGHEAERIERLVSGYRKVRVVRNAEYATGMFSSVRAGAAEIRGSRFFLLPGDMPLVSPATCGALLAARASVAVPSFSGRAGHPVLLDAAVAAEILAEAPSSNLRVVLARHGRTFVQVDDPGVLFDVDTEEDYRAAVSAFRDGFSAPVNTERRP